MQDVPFELRQTTAMKALALRAECAEIALRESEERFEKILAGLPGCILIINEQQRVVYANSLACQHLGSSNESVVGRSVCEILSMSREQWKDLIVDVPTPQAEGAPRYGQGEFQVNKRVYEYRLFPLALYGGGQSQMGLVICDITEHKQLQEQLIQAEKLASLGTLLSGMAHEINNPVHGILAMAEIILEETDPAKIKEYAEDIVDYSKHVAAVVHDCASYARPASRDGEMQIDLNERLLEAVKMVRRNPHFGDVEVATEFGTLPSLWARRSEIDQVFVNLISNAIHAMQGEGRLTLATRAEADFISASVTDTGIGIPKANLKKIFDPFFTTKESGKGTGLGLSIVHKIVAKYGGRIIVESEETKGTSFIVQFAIRKIPTK